MCGILSNMNYQKIYTDLCAKGQARRAVTRGKPLGFEDHHIIPKSFGGSNARSNLTRLSPREHFVAHRLLARIYPDSSAMQQALWFMQNTRDGCKLYGRSFELARTAHAHHVKTIMLQPERAAQQSALASAQWADPYTRAKMMAAPIRTRDTHGTPVHCVELNMTFVSQTSASRYMESIGVKCKASHINGCVNGDRRITAGGFTWVHPGAQAKKPAPYLTPVVCVAKALIFESQVVALDWLKHNGVPKPSSGFLNGAVKGTKRTAYGSAWRYATPEESAALKEKGASWAPLSDLRSVG